MSSHAETNACNACAKSKRKCGRQTPACARCLYSGKACVYPPTRNTPISSSQALPSDGFGASLNVEEGLLAEIAGDTSSRTASNVFRDDLILGLEDGSPALSSIIETTGASMASADWFLGPETWKISHAVESSVVAAAGITTLKKYIARLQSWFERWVTTGSNPFIHAILYSTKYPACLQAAYTTLASYIHRTPANKEIVLQIVEDRSNDLLQENGATQDIIGSNEWVDEEQQDVDLFKQLARLHALMVYQMIGLFDGDIRSRHVAQGHMAVQNSWVGKLVQSAAEVLSNIQAASTYLIGWLPTSSTHAQQQWYVWIVSESIRRTWLVAASMSPIFQGLQQRWSRCPGGVMYTNRSGLWNATSATEWDQRCREKDVAFLQRFACANFLNDSKPADIDEFGLAMFDITFNAEFLEQWRYKGAAC